MRKNFGIKSFCYPEAVFVIGTYNQDSTPNAMTAAWAGIYDTNQIFVSLSDHLTCENFKKTKELTISFGTKDYVEACDYVGIVSGNKEPNKVSKCGLTAKRSEFVNAPYFEELKVSLDCKVNTILENSDGIKLVCDIVNISADESILTNGLIDPKKLEPLMYDSINNRYYTIGEYVADAFKCGLKYKK
jgi:flavin reductase (DIM6/NTAB) family NADH-FMN oxidoreductase RutF